MNAQELRIGNYFYPINREGKVHLPHEIPFKIFTIEPFKVTACQVNKNFAQVKKMCEFDIKNVSEIPLTEEWLIKLGFEKYKGVFRIKLKDDQYLRCAFCTIYLSMAIDEYDQIGGRGTVGLNSIQYVHQLQNIYYSLTGQELTINTK